MGQWLGICLPGQGCGFSPWSGKIPRATGELSPCAVTTEPAFPRPCAPQQGKPPQREARTPPQGIAPTQHNQRKATRNNQDPAQPKINKQQKKAAKNKQSNSLIK